LNIYIWN